MNIKTKFYLLVFAFFSISFFSCKKDNTINTPVLSEFATPTAIGKYFVKDDPNSVFKIPVGITTVSNKPRTVTFSVSSPTGAVEGQQYNLGTTSIIIPAGTAQDSISLKGIFEGYASGRVDTLIFTITGGDVSTFTGYAIYKVVMRQYCDVILSDLEGDYSAIDNGTYGPYSVSIVPGGSAYTSATTGTFQLDNLWDVGVPTLVTVTLDWADPANFSTSIADQEYADVYDLWVSGDGAAGSFSSCDQTFTFKYTLYFKSTGDTYAEGQVTVINR